MDGPRTAHSPDLLKPFDEDVIEHVAEQMERTDVSATELADLVLAHQRSIYDNVPESRYIELRHEVHQYCCFENETTCFFVAPKHVWSLENTHTDFSENELATIAAVHTEQTNRRATETDQTDAITLLQDRYGFVVYKPPFMKRAYQLHQETLLSDREAEVQALVEEGHSSSTIATILGISTGAVDSLRYNRIAKKAALARATVDLLPAD